MDITSAIRADLPQIQSYGAGGFTVNAVRYDGSILVFPTGTFAWNAKAMDAAALQSLATIDELASLEILLLGTGVSFMRPEKNGIDRLRCQGVKIEVMDTGAACRTYAMLLAEGRRVGAALIAM